MYGPRPVEVSFAEPCVTSGVIGNLQLNVFRDRPTREAILRGCEELERLANRYPEGTLSISTTHASQITVPDADGRAGINEANDRLEKILKASAVVLIGEGFWVSAIRSMVTTLMIITPRPYPSKFFGDDLGAAEWLCENGWNRDWHAEDVPPATRHLASLE